VLGSKRDAESNFMRSLAYHVRDHTVNSDARQYHREGSEYAKQNHRETLRGHRIGYDSIERDDPIHRLLAVHPLQHGSNGSRHRQRLAFRSNGVPDVADKKWNENFRDRSARIVELRLVEHLGAFGQAIVLELDVPDDSDNPRPSADIRYVDPFSDWVLAGEILPRKYFINHNHF
jgi:hypothetical protein